MDHPTDDQLAKQQSEFLRDVASLPPVTFETECEIPGMGKVSSQVSIPVGMLTHMQFARRKD